LSVSCHHKAVDEIRHPQPEQCGHIIVGVARSSKSSILRYLSVSPMVSPPFETMIPSTAHSSFIVEPDERDGRNSSNGRVGRFPPFTSIVTPPSHILAEVGLSGCVRNPPSGVELCFEPARIPTSCHTLQQPPLYPHQCKRPVFTSPSTAFQVQPRSRRF